MAGNSAGTVFRITTFGESHGEMIGVVIDGCPAGLALDIELIQKDLDRRKPGQSKLTTQRKESDQARIVSGVFEGHTTGTPISILIPNEDQRSTDYAQLKSQHRPSHADFTYDEKYGFRDPRGGGRSSARETATWVAAGAVAKVLLGHHGVKINAYVSKVGSIGLPEGIVGTGSLDLALTETNPVRCPDPELAAKMEALILAVKSDGDTIGGVVSCTIKGCPIGLGEPVFDKLHADLGKAMLSINAAKGFEYGSGFAGVEMRGSEHNDLFVRKKSGGGLETITNHSGGVQGGISNGMEIFFRVAFKPVATIMKAQNNENKKGENVTVVGKGRHDPCVVPRAVPIVEAMAALVLADHLLRHRLSRVTSKDSNQVSTEEIKFI